MLLSLFILQLMPILAYHHFKLHKVKLKVKKQQKISKVRPQPCLLLFFLNLMEKQNPSISISYSTNILTLETLVSYKRQTDL